MSKDKYRTLVEAIVEGNCIPMATPFDERSVDLCEELDIPILKIASSDINDWILIERIALTRYEIDDVRRLINSEPDFLEQLQ